MGVMEFVLALGMQGFAQALDMLGKCLPRLCYIFDCLELEPETDVSWKLMQHVCVISIFYVIHTMFSLP